MYLYTPVSVLPTIYVTSLMAGNLKVLTVNCELSSTRLTVPNLLREEEFEYTYIRKQQLLRGITTDLNINIISPQKVIFHSFNLINS